MTVKDKTRGAPLWVPCGTTQPTEELLQEIAAIPDVYSAELAPNGMLLLYLVEGVVNHRTPWNATRQLVSVPRR